MAQPVGHVLRGDAAGGAVFHQGHVVDVGHLGAAHTLIHPADRIPENALGVVVQLGLLVGLGPVGLGGHRNGEDVFQLGALAALGDLGLASQHVDLVVVGGVQGGGGGAGHPGAVGAGLGMADLLLQHGLHQVGHGPHALADLGDAGQAAGQAHVDVVVFVGVDPRLGLHVALAHHRAGFHRGVDLVAGAVEEARVDEGDARARSADGFLQVDGGAALFVHDAELDGVGRQAQHLLDMVEDLVGEGHFLGPVHLGLDDVDGAFGGVAGATGLLQVVHGDEHRAHGVDHAFGRFPAFLVQDGGAGHEVADVAHQHERAALQRQLTLAVGRGVDAIGVQAAGEGLAALADFLGEVALHQAQPVAVDVGLVLTVDGRDGVLAVHDGGDGRFHHHVGHAGRVGLADGVVAVDAQVDVQLVLAQQHGRGRTGITLVAHEEGGILQARGAVGGLGHQLAVGHLVGGDVLVAALGQRGHFVQEALGPGDDLIAASRVVAAALGQAADGVGAVQGVIQAAPAGVGGVERVASVHDGHDQLRAGHLGDGVIDVGGVDGKVGAFWHQIADLGQEGLVGGHVLDGTGMGAVPVVELFLDIVTLGQQGAVLGAQVVDEAGQALPEGVGADAGAGQSLLDQVMKGGGHLQAESFDTMGHGSLRGIDEFSENGIVQVLWGDNTLLAVYPPVPHVTAGPGPVPAGLAIGCTAPGSGGMSRARASRGPVFPWCGGGVRFSEFWRDFALGCDAFAYN